MDIKRTDLVYEVSPWASVELLSNQTNLKFLLSKTAFLFGTATKIRKPQVNFNIPNLKSEGWHLHDTHGYKDGKISGK